MQTSKTSTTPAVTPATRATFELELSGSTKFAGESPSIRAAGSNSADPSSSSADPSSSSADSFSFASSGVVVSSTSVVALVDVVDVVVIVDSVVVVVDTVVVVGNVVVVVGNVVLDGVAVEGEAGITTKLEGIGATIAVNIVVSGVCCVGGGLAEYGKRSLQSQTKFGAIEMLSKSAKLR